ncbi:MAG: CotH kinase family protein [Clostridia bacterium]|nr:CotH kinase family protein [Clostridia bacterium]
MNEHKTQEIIHSAVLDSLVWLDKSPSQENEILKKTEKEILPLMTASHSADGVTIGLSSGASVNRPGFHWLKPSLIFCTVMILVVEIWAVYQNVYLNQFRLLDVVSQPDKNNSTPEPFLAAAAVQNKQNEHNQPLDRIDIYADQDALWNEETGILTEGEKIEKIPGSVPFKNAVYRNAYNNGTSAEGEMIYQSDLGAVLFKDKISLRLGGDYFSVDMPQKSFQIDALDGAFDYRIFDDRSTDSYPSLLLRNSGGDCLYTRVADGVQQRLIEKYTDTNLLTLAWRPAEVYLNGEYWGIYNIRESLDAHTICRYEQISDDIADSITILQISGFAEQGNASEFKTMQTKIKNSIPAENTDDLTYLEQEIDIDSFLDWLAVEIYFGNSDYGTGRFYKVPGGKWKCLIQNLDYGLFLSDYNAVSNYLKNEKTDNIIFRKILEVDQYRKLFLTKLGKLYKALTTEVMQNELDACVAWIEPGMKAHLERWAPYNDGTIVLDAPSDPEKAWDYWKQRIDRMRNGTMVKRPWNVYLHTQEFFGLTNQEMAEYFQ